MEKWSGGYALVKILVYYTFWLSHKRIVSLGKEKIPKNKPIIFAPNHQNALMDPLAVLLTNHTQPVWLARADIFKLKITRPILRFLKMVPVYRIRDGKENLQNNEETFDLSVRVLENNQAMALFPEAAHTGKRQMITHKKAVPRIAFLAEGKSGFNLGVQIVPVGIYYSHYWEFNRSVIVNYGTPIQVAKYHKAFLDNEQLAIMELRDEIYRELLPLTLNIHSRESYNAYEEIRELAGHRYSCERHFNKDPFINRFFSDKELIEKIEAFEKQDPGTFRNLVEELQIYTMAKNKLHLKNEPVNRMRLFESIFVFAKLIAAIVSLPFFLPGVIFNGPQFLLARNMINKRVKDPVFKGTFNLVVGMLLFPLIHLLIAIVMGVIVESMFFAIFFFLLMPLLGKLSYQLYEFYSQIFRQLKLAWLLIFKNKELVALWDLKKEIEDKIVDAAENNSIIFET